MVNNSNVNTSHSAYKQAKHLYNRKMNSNQLNSIKLRCNSNPLFVGYVAQKYSILHTKHVAGRPITAVWVRECY